MAPQINRLLGLKAAATKAGWAGWIKGEADERALLHGHRFNLERAERVQTFLYRFCRHAKGKWRGKPLELQPWQRDDVIFPLFGWEHSETLLRRFRKAYIEIPKKNGKSTLASGVGLYMLCGDGEPGAEVYAAATNRKQAGIVHGDACDMVEASEELSEGLIVTRSTNTIGYPDGGGWFKAMSKSPTSEQGQNAHCIIADELHAWHGRALYDAIQWAFAAREQPLFFAITTAGDDLESICYEQHRYAEGVMQGQIHDDGFLGYIRTAPDPNCSLMDMKAAKTANPSLGVTIRIETFEAEAREASKSNTSARAWRRYRLNIWTTVGAQWLTRERWMACKHAFTEKDLEGEECYGGLDLSKTRDSTSLQLIFPGLGERVKLLSYFWLPRQTAIDLQDKVSWLAWADEGLVELTDGDVCDYGFVFNGVKRLNERFRIKELAFDPWQAEQLTQDIEAELGIKRVAFGQTIGNLSPPTTEFERLVLAKLLEHNGHPIMTWQMSNAVCRVDSNGNKRLSKPTQDDIRKIDGPAAGVMALGRKMIGQGDDSGDVGVRSL